MSEAVSQLRLDDTDFLISSLVLRCPRTMMLRELIMNAIEAAARAEKTRRVEILATIFDGVRKLTIRNTGPGLARDELYRMCDIGTSIRKIKDLSGNFGMGGKIASLGANPIGVRYRSCCAGRVYEVTLAESKGHYGRLWQRAGGGLADIREVTKEVQAEGLPLDYDWTEVALFGARIEQDTVADPYGGNPASAPNWIVDVLTNRFFDIAPGVEILFADKLYPAAQPHRFVPLAQLRSNPHVRSEIVQATDNIRIHYYFINPADQSDNPVTGKIALLHRSELYEVESGSSWAYNAPIFGIPFATNNVIVLIELEDSYEVQTEQYRQFLCYAGGMGSHITPKNFATLVRENRPGWLIELQSEYAASARVSDNVQRPIQELVRQLSLAAENDTPIRPPEIYILRDPEEIMGRWLDARIARYEYETNELFVNVTYPSIDRFADNLVEALAPEIASHPRAREAALQLAEEVTIQRLGGTVVRLLYRSRSPSWTAGNREKALSGEALSLAAEDLDLWLHPTRVRLVASLGSDVKPFPAASM